jgi:hypothetical protein
MPEIHEAQLFLSGRNLSAKDKLLEWLRKVCCANSPDLKSLLLNWWHIPGLNVPSSRAAYINLSPRTPAASFCHPALLSHPLFFCIISEMCSQSCGLADRPYDFVTFMAFYLFVMGHTTDTSVTHNTNHGFVFINNLTFYYLQYRKK